MAYGSERYCFHINCSFSLNSLSLLFLFNIAFEDLPCHIPVRIVCLKFNTKFGKINDVSTVHDCGHFSEHFSCKKKALLTKAAWDGTRRALALNLSSMD